MNPQQRAEQAPPLQQRHHASAPSPSRERVGVRGIADRRSVRERDILRPGPSRGSGRCCESATAGGSQDFALIACGGIGNAEQVWQLMEAGASAVQLYTSFIYEGPGLPGRINRDLVELMDSTGAESLPG